MLIKRLISRIIVLCVCKREIQKMIARNNNINSKEIKYYENNNINQLVAGCFLSILTIKNYNPFNGGFLTALCANVCILCCEIDKKKREDAESKNASDNIEIR